MTLFCCAGFDWGRVNFLYSRSCGAVFGFVLEAALITQRRFHYRWAVLTHGPGIFCSSPHQPAGWGCRVSWEATQPGQLTSAGQWDAPYRVTSCAVYKAGGRLARGPLLGDGLVGSSCSRLPQLSVLGLISLPLLFSFSLQFINILFQWWNCSSLSPPVFSLLPFQFSPPSCWGERASICVVL